MKASEIKATEKTILLGIFSTETFHEFRYTRYGFKVFGTFRSLFQESDEQYPGILGLVKRTCEWSDRIIFILDEVQFPINVKESVTCAELELVCKFENLYNKTIFIKGENVIEFDRNLVI